MRIEEVVRKYRYSKELRRFSNNENNDRFYSSIQSKEDIKKYQRDALNTYEQISKNYPIHEDDLEDIRDSIKEYEICVRKGIAMMDLIMGKWDITAEELTDFIDKLFELYKLYDKFQMKKLYQD